MTRHSSRNMHANRTHLPRRRLTATATTPVLFSNPHPRIIRDDRVRHAPRRTRLDDCVLEETDVAPRREAVDAQIQDQEGSELARSVVGEQSAARRREKRCSSVCLVVFVHLFTMFAVIVIGILNSVRLSRQKRDLRLAQRVAAQMPSADGICRLSLEGEQDRVGRGRKRLRTCGREFELRFILELACEEGVLEFEGVCVGNSSGEVEVGEAHYRGDRASGRSCDSRVSSDTLDESTWGDGKSTFHARQKSAKYGEDRFGTIRLHDQISGYWTWTACSDPY